MDNKKYNIFLVGIVAVIILMFSCKEKIGNEIVSKIIDNKSVQLFSILDSKETGVSFQNVIKENANMNQLTYEYYYNGGGVAIADFNNDGLQDIFFTGNLTENKLYINKSDLKFEDISKSAGILGKKGWKTGVTIVDINDDGYKDIYVCYSGRSPEEQRKNALLINQGNLTFKDRAKEYGLDDSGYGTQAVFFDFDRDNDLDMFLVNHSIFKLGGQNPGQWKPQRDPFIGDKLFENTGHQFIDVSLESGINQNPIGYGLSVSIGDLNQDGWPDIYVSNDYLEDDYIYINNQDGTFSDRAKQAFGHISMNSMGSDIADINNDGLLDIIALDMVAEDNFRSKTNMSGMNPKEFWYGISEGFHFQYMFNSLQLNMGNNKFSEIAQLSGVSNTDWSWAPLLADLDNDGYKDLYVTNGYLRDTRNKDFINIKLKLSEKYQQPTQKELDDLLLTLLDTMPSVPLPNYCFKNEGNLVFNNKSSSWGIDQPSFSNGAAYGDLDNDGDLELVVNNINSNAFIYKNNSKELLKNNHFRVKLIGPQGNNDGIGAKVNIKYNGNNQLIEKYLTRGYQSSIEDYIHFGIGKNEKIDDVEITWPDGMTQTIQNISANTTLTIDYKDAQEGGLVNRNQSKKLLFEDITDKLQIQYVHKENPYDDFIRESLLPHKMSQFGPALAIEDLNGDGLEDIYIGGALEQKGYLYIQNRNGHFDESIQKDFEKDKNYEDTGAVFFDADNDGDQDLYVVSGGNEKSISTGYYQDRFYKNVNGTFHKNKNAIPIMISSGSCVVPHDFDNDGDVDLFIGGRQTPGKYPLPTTSTILLNESKGNQIVFKDVTARYAPMLKDIGMVTSALWMDVDDDDLEDLVIAGEWMSVRVLKNLKNEFIDISESTGLLNETGWWNTLACGDFDNDGDLDFVGGNLGKNYKYKADYEHPFKIYTKDFDSNKTLDIVLGYYEKEELYPLRGRECSSNQMPFIKKKFKTYDAFARASLEDVYGDENLKTATQYEAKNFATSYFENLGNGKFKAKALPILAQISSVNAIEVSDFDLDGNLDMVIAGNLLGSEVETPRSDASYGFLIKGDGKGDFKVQYPYENGLYITGEVKHIAHIQIGDKGSKSLIFAINNKRLQFTSIQNTRSNK